MDFYESLIENGYGKYVEKGVNVVSAENLEQAVFDASILPQATNKIVLKKNLFDDVLFIKESIDLQRAKGTVIELPFVMFGSEKENGEVFVDKIEIDFDKFMDTVSSSKEQVAQFDGLLTEKINNFINTSTAEKPVIIHGHTHPNAEKIGISNLFTNSFSFADMQGYKDLSKQIQEANKKLGKDIQVAGMVINSEGDFNAVFCDVEHDGMFYKINDISLQDVGKLPSFQGKSLFSEQSRSLDD